MSAHGFWLFVEATAREYFLPFNEFPWFKQATAANILAVEIERVRRTGTDLKLVRVDRVDEVAATSIAGAGRCGVLWNRSRDAEIPKSVDDSRSDEKDSVNCEKSCHPTRPWFS